MKTIEKPWGKEEILSVQQKYMLKRLTMKFKHRCSMQYHNLKTETIYVVWGTLFIHNELGHVRELNPGDSCTIVPGEVHRMEGGSSPHVVYLEASTPETNDVVRLEDDYGRN
jgi:mannose-6-phosphate isomerase-like protein (cupin superfamily)